MKPSDLNSQSCFGCTEYYARDLNDNMGLCNECIKYFARKNIDTGLFDDCIEYYAPKNDNSG